MKLFTARRPGREMTNRPIDRQQTFHRTTTLQVGPINHIENDCF